MSTAPLDLRRARAYICERTGLSAASVGIVGNAAHTWGYHLGRDRIYTIPPGRGSRDPSVQAARDRSGLDDNASALDIGRHKQLVDLGHFLYAQRGAEDARDVAELIAERGDGTHVWSWRRGGGTSGNPASDELPHHLHVSYYRDSRSRDKVELYRRFYEPEDPDMALTHYGMGDQRRTFAVGTEVFDQPGGRKVGTIQSEHIAYRIAAEVRPEGGGRWWLLDGGTEGDPLRYVKAPA